MLVLSQGGLVHATLPSALPELLLAPEKPLFSVNVYHREDVNTNRDAEQERAGCPDTPCPPPSILFGAGATQVAHPGEAQG